MTLRKQTLAGLGDSMPSPSIVALVGLRPFLASPFAAVLRAQDGIAPMSRRTVLSWGLRGDAEWRVPNTNPESATRIYPDRTTWYVVARTRIEVTPGCFFQITGACVPSGETERAATSGEIAAGSLAFVPDGAAGWVRVTIVWSDRASGSETSTYEIQLPSSSLQYGAEDVTAGGLWRTISDFGIVDMNPPDILANTTELARFSRHVTATITVEHRGSPRVIDASIHEVPVAVALDPATDQAYLASHLYAAGQPDAPGSAATHALASRAAQALTVARAQALRLGPVLLEWTAYTETGGTATATILARTTSNDGTTFESLLNSAQTGAGPAAYNATLGGWSVSCGGYARRWAPCNHLVLRDRIAAVPVMIRVYGRTITAGVGTVRVQTALYSYVDVVLPVAGSAAWTLAYGWLEVGITPEQPVVAQILINHLGGAGSLSVEAVEVSVCGASVVV